MKKATIWAAVAAGMMGAATAATSTADYVQDGLVAHFDGIDNAGTGTHDPNATTWTDLVSGLVATKATSDAIGVEENHYHFTGKGSCFHVTIPSFMDEMTANGGFTIEYVASYTSLNGQLGIGAEMGYSGMYFQGDNLTYTTASGQCGSWLASAAGTVGTGSIVYTADCSKDTVEPYYNGALSHGNRAVTWSASYPPSGILAIGNMAAGYAAVGDIYSVRVYNRRLTAAEVAANRAVDVRRFPRAGGFQATAGFYPYIYPLYIADVAEGSASIDEVTFKKVETDGASVTTDVSYAEFAAATLTGTIVKRGGGTLTFDKTLLGFSGPVHVEEGVAIGTVSSNCFGSAKAGANDKQRVYVHSGATVVRDAVNNVPYSSEREAFFYEGAGYPGMGGALVWRNGDKTGYSRWQPGSSSRAVGPASIFLDMPSSGGVTFTYGRNQPSTDFNVNGQDVLIYGRTAGTYITLDACGIEGFGNLVLSNMTMVIDGNSGRLVPKNGNRSTVRFRGGARWKRATYDNLALVQLYQTATLYIDDLEYMHITNGKGGNPWGGQTNNWWCGPVVLNDHLRCYNNSAPAFVGCTFKEQVSGPKGFRPWVASYGTRYGRGMRLNLLYPTNTFEGGIVADGGSIGVWAERAVPSQEGAGLVSVTNGYVYFGRQPTAAKWPVFEMPVTEFVGSGAVTNGTGTWQGLVKKGDGTLDYNSQLGGAYLDLQDGTVKFNTQYREAYAGGNAAYAPDGYAAALPAFAKLKGTAGTLDLGGAGGSYTVQDMEGTPSVANGSLTVTGTWTLDTATLGAHTATISGTLAFGAEAAVAASGDLDAVTIPHGKGYLVATAASVTGLPKFHSGRWLLVESGGEVYLQYASGTTLTIR